MARSLRRRGLLAFKGDDGILFRVGFAAVCAQFVQFLQELADLFGGFERHVDELFARLRVARIEVLEEFQA